MRPMVGSSEVAEDFDCYALGNQIRNALFFHGAQSVTDVLDRITHNEVEIARGFIN